MTYICDYFIANMISALESQSRGAWLAVGTDLPDQIMFKLNPKG